MHEPLEGIAQADALLGRPFPLPEAPLPLARWVDVIAVGDGAVEVAWNLDDSRPRAPGRLALYAGVGPAPPRELPHATHVVLEEGVRWLTAPLAEAQPSLRPVHELSWESGGLHLRLTAQGPWNRDELLGLVASIVV